MTTMLVSEYLKYSHQDSWEIIQDCSGPITPALASQLIQSNRDCQYAVIVYENIVCNLIPVDKVNGKYKYYRCSKKNCPLKVD